MSTNPELALAFDFVSQTDRHVFLTGKAGTGKTTFLHRVRREVSKRTAVVAPTGVAAINAGGVTIHSLLQLPFGVLTPQRVQDALRARRYATKKLDLIRTLDLLVIDEISMVRADVLDAIDLVLRSLRRNDRPFGGLQLLMIGDLHQLSPVVRDTDGDQLREQYDTPYFFGARVFQQAPPRVIQLRHIYRQQDDRFIHLLNEVRHNRMSADVLRTLNDRYRPDLPPEATEGYITLTSHNRAADAINDRQLERLTTPLHCFEAAVTGTFPESMYPNHDRLSFRVGAQVMFNKNDTTERLYYNGKIGRITAIEDDRITVSCPGDEIAIPVDPVTWDNRRYVVDPDTKEITEDTVGTYTQHPLRLAWAITIHKSQGLTFDRVIIDAAAAFAHGQVYVALSRCRTLEGIYLHSRIGESSVRTDATVSQFSRQAADHPPTDAELRADRRAFELTCLRDIFSFTRLRQLTARLRRTLLEHERSISGTGPQVFARLSPEMDGRLGAVGQRFLPHLTRYGRAAALPSEQPDLLARLERAAAYFLPLLRDDLLPVLGDLPLLTDNERVRKQLDQQLGDIRLELFTKQRLFEALREGFSTTGYCRARADAALDFKQVNRQRSGRTRSAASHDKHPELVRQLTDWRAATARGQDLRINQVLSTRSLLLLADHLPTSKQSLLAIRGVGPTTVSRYGPDLLRLVGAYVAEQGLTGDLFPAVTPKVSSRQQSMDLFTAGRTVAEIAAERELAESTIYGHLADFVTTGVLVADRVVDREDLNRMQAVIRAQEGERSLSELRTLLGERYAYGPIRIALAELLTKQPAVAVGME